MVEVAEQHHGGQHPVVVVVPHDVVGVVLAQLEEGRLAHLQELVVALLLHEVLRDAVGL